MNDENNKTIKEKLDALIPVFARASIGDFSQDVPIPEEDDELTETYAGIQIMLDVIRDKIRNLEKEIEIRKRTQEDLVKREERFQSTLDTMSEGFQIIDFDLRYVYVNNSVTMHGHRSKDELLGRTITEMYPGIENTEFYKQLKRCLQERVSHQMENEFVYPDGSKNWFELRIEPITEGVFILSLDINDRKMIEAKIAREKAEDEALLESIGEGIIATDPDGRIVMVNKAFSGLLGWNENEIIGKHTAEVIKLLDEKGVQISDDGRPLKRVLTNGVKITETHYVLRKDQSKLPVIITATPVTLNQTIIGGVEIFHDITREKELDRAKDEFISLASHELRTPMTAIKGLTSMIINGDYGPYTEQLKRPLENITISSDRQIRLINDLLNVSRIQTGSIQYNLTKFSIKEVLNEVVESLQPIAKEKQIEFVHEKIDDIYVQGDIDWVKQVLNNLLGNALKFTDKGSISISTRTNEDFDFIVVIDTGTGIDPADQEKLFERFRQFSNSTSNKYVGSGLGLYIARNAARKMGGDIRLEKSALGEGSTFVFSIPKADTPYAQKVKEDLQKELQIANDSKNG